MKEIELAEHSGFCFGVTKAVDTAEKELAEAGGDPLYCIGRLIHNRSVSEELEEKGLRTIASI
ncbi:MAG: 4-hydroxy-3-methylbut-2-enyl diphosphate reductase, partial [Firmicutes bacterium]|nr:4-hydroxy-3-methylbut-2-enyl diphosphate reductase [Bacillota bacterium]